MKKIFLSQNLAREIGLFAGQQLLFVFKIHAHHSFNFSLVPDLALSDSRTEIRHFGFPGFCIHQFGPERPCPALARPGFVNGTAFFFEKETVGLALGFTEVPDLLGLIAVLFLKVFNAQVEVFCEAFAVFLGEKDKAEFTV